MNISVFEHLKIDFNEETVVNKSVDELNKDISEVKKDIVEKMIAVPALINEAIEKYDHIKLQLINRKALLSTNIREIDKELLIANDEIKNLQNMLNILFCKQVNNKKQFTTTPNVAKITDENKSFDSQPPQIQKIETQELMKDSYAFMMRFNPAVENYNHKINSANRFWEPPLNRMAEILLLAFMSPQHPEISRVLSISQAVDICGYVCKGTKLNLNQLRYRMNYSIQELWGDEDEASDKFITVTDRDPDNHQYYYFNTLGERIVHCNARFYELTPIGFATATKIIKKYSLAKKPKFSITILDDSNKTTNTTQLINTTNA